MLATFIPVTELTVSLFTALRFRLTDWFSVMEVVDESKIQKSHLARCAVARMSGSRAVLDCSKVNRVGEAAVKKLRSSIRNALGVKPRGLSYEVATSTLPAILTFIKLLVVKLLKTSDYAPDRNRDSTKSHKRLVVPELQNRIILGCDRE
jgi:hypothetical protein